MRGRVCTQTSEYGIKKAYVLSEANVSADQRSNGAVFYPLLYMLPFIAEEARGSQLANIKVGALSW